MPSSNDENKLIRDLGAFGVLMNASQSLTTQKNDIIRVSKSIFHVVFPNPSQFLQEEFSNIIEMIVHNASNSKTVEKFVYEVNGLIECIEDPVLTFDDEELVEALQIHLTRCKKALMKAISGNFEVKEYIQNVAIIDVLRNISLLDNNMIIPESLRDVVAKLKARVD